MEPLDDILQSAEPGAEATPTPTVPRPAGSSWTALRDTRGAQLLAQVLAKIVEDATRRAKMQVQGLERQKTIWESLSEEERDG